MRIHTRSWIGVAAVIACVAATLGVSTPSVSTAAARGGAAAPPTGRLIVKLREGAGSTPVAGGSLGHVSTHVAALAERAGVAVVRSRPVAGRTHVLTLLTVPAADTEAAILARLRSDPEVEWAERDARRYAHAVPNDTDYGQQWALQPPTSTLIAAIDAQTGWLTTTGGAGVVIGQLDTGVRFDHPDLLRAQDGGRLLPGYDFISADSGSTPATYLTANDGDGWDPDASDPGDWVAVNDPILSFDTSCLPSGTTSEASSWHGTHTAGILGALTNNGLGVAGVTWKGWVLPVRVLGKCGGYDSDIVAGMQWAAGMTVLDADNNPVPTNPYPARVLNMSLGGTGSCPSVYSDVIATLVARGVLVVASAGNEGGPVDAPANCPGVAGIAGLRTVGTKVGYSSLGPEVALAAPAGNCGQQYVSGGPCLYEIHTTTNLGATTPGTNGYSDQINNPALGTSFSAPLATGTVALMLAANGNLTPAQLVARLKQGSVAFPTSSADAATQPPVCHTPASSTDIQDTECICTTAVCGAGMLNVVGALHAALAPIAVLTLPTSVSAGSPVSLSAAATTAACGHSVTSYLWTSGGATLGTGSTVSVPAPTSGTTVVTLTVGDDASRTDTVTITLTPNSASAVSASTGAPPPAAAGSGACPAAIVPTGPLATAALSAPASAAVGASIGLTWSSTNATGCEASGGATDDGWVAARATSGSASVTENTPGTYTYAIACYGSTASATAQAVVTVAYAPAVTVTASPTSATAGQSFAVTWSSTHATSCSATGGTSGDGWANSSLATSGTANIKEASAGNVTYTVQCMDGPLSASGNAVVTVNAPSSGGGGTFDAAAVAALLALAGARLTRRARSVRG